HLVSLMATVVVQKVLFLIRLAVDGMEEQQMIFRRQVWHQHMVFGDPSLTKVLFLILRHLIK
ncbi:MAG: hypothetical protein LBH34_04710, partial [Prevotellaceae bacterium]|nr:hypothetical protein [Prevotellaceae bacterium]